VTFDRVFTGPRRRQIRTAEVVGDAYRAAGAPWPEPVVLPEFDEFQAEDVIREFTPLLAERHPHIRALVEALRSLDGSEASKEIFGELFREVTSRWVKGEVDSPALESWEGFCERVRRGVESACDGSAGTTRAVVFSSAGPTAATVRMALDLSALSTLELSWRPRNSSVSEFVFSVGRLGLQTFNTIPHLDAPSLVTLW